MKGKKMKKICTVCNGNGFVRVPFEQAREEQQSRSGKKIGRHKKRMNKHEKRSYKPNIGQGR